MKFVYVIIFVCFFAANFPSVSIGNSKSKNSVYLLILHLNVINLLSMRFNQNYTKLLFYFIAGPLAYAACQAACATGTAALGVGTLGAGAPAAIAAYAACQVYTLYSFKEKGRFLSKNKNKISPYMGQIFAVCKFLLIHQICM